jgi:mannose/fructose/N-acetylgalactosamine-specific phosphotransferase system component IID
VSSETANAAPDARPPRAVLLRAWMLDAAWDAERMQGVGALHALLPVLRRAPDVSAAMRRHAGYFNINAWMAPTILAALAWLEHQGRGADAVRVRERLAAPLSGAGDLFVWSALRPACLGLGLALLVAGWPLWGMVAALVAYDLPLLWLFGRGFARGAAAGDDPIRALRALQPPAAGVRLLRQAVGLLGGGLVGWSAASAAGSTPGGALGVGLALVLGYYAARRQVSPGIVLLILVAVISFARRIAPTGAVWVP